MVLCCLEACVVIDVHSCGGHMRKNTYFDFLGNDPLYTEKLECINMNCLCKTRDHSLSGLKGSLYPGLHS